MCKSANALRIVGAAKPLRNERSEWSNEARLARNPEKPDRPRSGRERPYIAKKNALQYF